MITRDISSRLYVRPVDNRNILQESVLDDATNGSVDSLRRVIRNMEKLKPYYDNDLEFVKECVTIVNNSTNLLNDSKKMNILSEMFSAIQGRKLSKKSTKYICENLDIATDIFKEDVAKISDADRILRNRNKLMKNKQTNFVNALPRRYTSSMLEGAIIMNLISEVDKINMDDRVKVNVCLENIKYELESIGMPINDNILCECVYGYFASNSDVDRNYIRNAIKESSYVSFNEESFMDDIDAIWEVGDKISKGQGKEAIDFTKPTSKENFMTNIKAFMDRLFSKSEGEIVDGIPHILKIFKWGIIVAFAAQGLPAALLALPVVLANNLIGKKMDREKVGKIIKRYEKEIDSMRSKADSMDDGEKKANLKQAIESMEDGLYKLEDYQDSLYTEKENDIRKYGESVDWENFTFEQEASEMLDEAIMDDQALEVVYEILQVKDSIANIKELIKNDAKESSIKERIKQFMQKEYSFSAGEIRASNLKLTRLIRYLIYAACGSTIAVGVGIPVGIIAYVLSVWLDLAASNASTFAHADKLIADLKKEVEKVKKVKPQTDKTKQVAKILNVKIAIIEKQKKAYDEKMKMAKLNKKAIKEDAVDDLFSTILSAHPMSMYTFMGEPRMEMVDIWDKTRSTLMRIVKERFSDLLDKDAIQFATESDIERFIHADMESMYGYLGTRGSITIRLATVLPMNVPQLEDDNIVDFLEALCNALDTPLPQDYCVLVDGDEELYRIELSYNANIKMDAPSDDTIKEGVIPECMGLGLVYESYETMGQLDLDLMINTFNEEYKNYPMDKLINICEMISQANVPYVSNAILEHVSSRDNKYNSNSIAVQKNLTEATKLSGLYELYIRNKDFENAYNVIVNEGNVVTTLKTALMNFKKKAVNLKDKEKEASQRLDSSFEKFINDMDKANTEKTREKIIKGRKIPSLSNIIKIGIAGGVTAMINPVITAVGAVGMIATSHHATKKQKQEILDDIEINLKMVERKMASADSAGDDKAYEELLKIERKLKREKQRIIYNMKDHYLKVSSEH